MRINDVGGVGQVEVTTLHLPVPAVDLTATFTFSGKVLASFKETDRSPDHWHLGIANADGTGYREIFSGPIPKHPKANGIRFMPFSDNKRILLGDYVLECQPDLDDCERADLIPIRYPWDAEQDPRTLNHWSEIIIAPDNEHMAWTLLRTDIGAAVGLGVLQREAGGYVLEQPQIVSTIALVEKDPAKPGELLLRPVRGGEVKQFVHGGTALSLVGAKEGGLTDSVVQHVATGEVTQITRTPGYDETTIFSPDERLGLVMSTRGSKSTDPAVFGLLPRPRGGLATQGLAMHLYLYAVDGVRRFRKGNIGPVLVEIDRSIHEAGYQGVVLSDPDDAWVYCSPMSWHPGGRKAMWMEMARGSGTHLGGRQMRIRTVELHDYQPGRTVPARQTPDAIPYAIKDGGECLRNTPDINIEGKIVGRHSGYIAYVRRGRAPAPALMGSIQTTYVNFSDDGRGFYNGYERSTYSLNADSVFEADLELTGGVPGEMKLRATFSAITADAPLRLLFEHDSDGRPKSFGYASYNGVRLNVEDLSE